MLNIKVKAGEYIQIGEDIKVIIVGGISNQYKVMVDAPREYNIVRGKVLERNAKTEEEREKLAQYYPEPELSKEELQQLIEKRRRKKAEAAKKAEALQRILR